MIYDNDNRYIGEGTCVRQLSAPRIKCVDKGNVNGAIEDALLGYSAVRAVITEHEPFIGEE